jgi:hypothetical protein
MVRGRPAASVIALALLLLAAGCDRYSPIQQMGSLGDRVEDALGALDAQTEIKKWGPDDRLLFLTGSPSGFAFTWLAPSTVDEEQLGAELEVATGASSRLIKTGSYGRFSAARYDMSRMRPLATSYEDVVDLAEFDAKMPRAGGLLVVARVPLHAQLTSDNVKLEREDSKNKYMLLDPDDLGQVKLNGVLPKGVAGKGFLILIIPMLWFLAPLTVALVAMRLKPESTGAAVAVIYIAYVATFFGTLPFWALAAEGRLATALWFGNPRFALHWFVEFAAAAPLVVLLCHSYVYRPGATRTRLSIMLDTIFTLRLFIWASLFVAIASATLFLDTTIPGVIFWLSGFAPLVLIGLLNPIPARHAEPRLERLGQRVMEGFGLDMHAAWAEEPPYGPEGLFVVVSDRNEVTASSAALARLSDRELEFLIAQGAARLAQRKSIPHLMSLAIVGGLICIHILVYRPVSSIPLLAPMLIGAAAVIFVVFQFRALSRNADMDALRYIRDLRVATGAIEKLYSNALEEAPNPREEPYKQIQRLHELSLKLDEP